MRTDLGTIAKTVSGQPTRGDLPAPIGGDAAGAAANLAAALGVYDAESTAETLLGLLASDHARQRWAARSAGALGTPEGIGILVTLAESSDATVRATAAANLASYVTTGHGDPIAVASLRRCANDPGTLVPATVAQTIAGAPRRSQQAKEILLVLRGHASASVRRSVKTGLD